MCEREREREAREELKMASAPAQVEESSVNRGFTLLGVGVKGEVKPEDFLQRVLGPFVVQLDKLLDLRGHVLQHAPVVGHGGLLRSVVLPQEQLPSLPRTLGGGKPNPVVRLKLHALLAQLHAHHALVGLAGLFRVHGTLLRYFLPPLPLLLLLARLPEQAVHPSTVSLVVQGLGQLADNLSVVELITYHVEAGLADHGGGVVATIATSRHHLPRLLCRRLGNGVLLLVLVLVGLVRPLDTVNGH
mmetsp:Transcript_1569/g.4921  ORF Transcript_1569/g.4921 Transcript_1569/m.4921 type:complete len:245 (-) Transcript_1569:517-1251(-)